VANLSLNNSTVHIKLGHKQWKAKMPLSSKVDGLWLASNKSAFTDTKRPSQRNNFRTNKSQITTQIRLEIADELFPIIPYTLIIGCEMTFMIYI
jgi:hypothetical protein